MHKISIICMVGGSSMKRDLALWQFAGFVFTALGGTLLHFLYDLTDQNILIAPFSAVNESTWEHLKLLYYPLFVFALLQSRCFRDVERFWCVKLTGTVTGLVLIPLLYYTYNGIFGKSSHWINIAIFLIAAAIGLIREAQQFKKDPLQCKWSKLAFVLLCLIGVLFVLFTFAAPKIPMFRDPLTGSYGIDVSQ